MNKTRDSGLGGILFAQRPEVRRCFVRPIHRAPAAFAEALYGMWGNVTAQEAYDVLSSPDVTVTNAKDKELQLPKITKLDEQVRRWAT